MALSITQYLVRGPLVSHSQFKIEITHLTGNTDDRVVRHWIKIILNATRPSTFGWELSFFKSCQLVRPVTYRLGFLFRFFTTGFIVGQKFTARHISKKTIKAITNPIIDKRSSNGSVICSRKTQCRKIYSQDLLVL